MLRQMRTLNSLNVCMLSMNSKLKFIMNFSFNTKLFEGVVVVLKNQSTFQGPGLNVLTAN